MVGLAQEIQKQQMRRMLLSPAVDQQKGETLSLVSQGEALIQPHLSPHIQKGTVRLLSLTFIPSYDSSPGNPLAFIRNRHFCQLKASSRCYKATPVKLGIKLAGH